MIPVLSRGVRVWVIPLGLFGCVRDPLLGNDGELVGYDVQLDDRRMISCLVEACPAAPDRPLSAFSSEGNA